MNARQHYLGGLLVCLVLVAACDQSPLDKAASLREHYHNQYAVANEALEDRDFQAALDFYTRLIEQQPQNADAYARRGYVHYQYGEDLLALQDYATALDIEPGLARAHAGRALVYASMGERQQALRHVLKIDNRVRHDADIYVMLGRTYYWLKEYDDALNLYDEALDLDPELFQAYSGRGLVYTALGDYGSASKDFNAALDIREDYGVYNNLAVLSDQLGHYDQAITNFQNAVALNPEFAVGYANLGLAYINMWDFQTAETQCQESLKLDEYNCAAHYCLGRVYKASNDTDLLEQALRHYTQVLEYGCEYFNENYIANAYILRGQVKESLEFPPEDALADFQAAIQHDPRHTYAYLLLGDRTRGDEALAYYAQAIRLTPQYAAAYIKRGQTYEAQGKLQLALNDFQQAAELALVPSWQQTAAKHVLDVQERLQLTSTILSQPAVMQVPPPAVDKPPPDLYPEQAQPDLSKEMIQSVPLKMLEDIP